MFISEVYTDVSDKDRNFMCMDAYFALHSVYIKEDFVDNFSDIRTLKINEMMLYSKYDFIIRKEFKFGDILAETPVIKTDIPKLGLIKRSTPLVTLPIIRYIIQILIFIRMGFPFG